MKKKRPRKRVRKRRRSAPSRQKGRQYAEYHQLIFPILHDRLKREIEEALLETPRTVRREFWRTIEQSSIATEEDSWSTVATYSGIIEDKMRAIAQSHSPYFWLYMYRRIAPRLLQQHDGKTDAHTLGLVREIVECAICKYGDLGADDMKEVSELGLDDCFGGVLRDVLLEAGIGQSALQEFFSKMQATKYVVPSRFSAADLVACYALEGFAYEYWKFTALMRAIGKGESLSVESGEPQSRRSDALDRLLESFDRRTFRTPFAASNLGGAFLNRSAAESLSLACAQYNIEQMPWRDVCLVRKWRNVVQGVTNFILGVIDVKAFVDAHAFAADGFRAARGYSIDSVTRVLAALSMMVFQETIREGAAVEHLLRLYQRGYDLFLDRDLVPILADMAVVAPQYFQVADVERAAILESVTLTKASQARVSLWTRGPRFVLVPVKGGFLIDLTAFGGILLNAFFGMRFTDTEKGFAFEDEFRAFAASRSLDVLDVRKLKVAGEQREGDAFIRRGERLFVCECRTMERPLDVERGKPSVLKKRQEEFESKLAQVDGVVELIKRHPTGDNYDFLWAREVTACVVSPFVEWIWSEDPAMWLDPQTPRILSAREAVTFMLSSA